MLDNCLSQRPPFPDTAEELAPIHGYLRFVARQYLATDVGGTSGASDVVQTALLAAHKARESFRGDSKEQLRGWLRRIVINVARQFRRNGQVGPAQEPGTGTRKTPLALETATPSHIAMQQEQRERLARAVAALPELSRQVIRLRVEEDQSFVSIGERLSRTPDAVRMLYARAL